MRRAPKRAALFGLLALVPAAVNAAAPAGVTLAALSCAGGVQTITVPMRSDGPQEPSQTCCAKGCHGRKRGVTRGRGRKNVHAETRRRRGAALGRRPLSHDD